MDISRRYFMKTLHTQRVVNTRPTLEARKSVSAGIAFRQRLQPCFSLPGFGGVAALNRSEAKALLDILASGNPLAPCGARGTGWRVPPLPDACGFLAVTG